MVEVKYFGTARMKFEKKTEQFDARDVRELIQKISDENDFPVYGLKQFLIYVNEVNIDNLKGYKTKLNDGDKVMFLSPSGGG